MNKRQIDKKISLIPESVLNNNVINDSELLFLLKKTEKIITATYILTDFIPKEEIIKKTLKDNSHQILNTVCNLFYSRTNRAFEVKKIKSLFIKLLTQYNLAFVSGYISQMNTEIIKDEINNLIRIIDDFERELEDENFPDLKQSLFGVDVRNKRHYEAKDKTVRNKENIKDTDKKSFKINLNNNNNREEKVIEIIKDKKEVSIKDISEVILDCSEKTIQRTLNKMISEGKVLKTGERRWAKYTLV